MADVTCVSEALVRSRAAEPSFTRAEAIKKSLGMAFYRSASISITSLPGDEGEDFFFSEQISVRAALGAPKHHRKARVSIGHILKCLDIQRSFRTF